jgi:hypothetical protein
MPKNACYSAHCGKAYVWVCPEGMECFSRFVPVCQKIARIDVGRGRTSLLSTDSQHCRKTHSGIELDARSGCGPDAARGRLVCMPLGNLRALRRRNQVQERFDLLRKPTLRDIVGYGAERDYHLGVFDNEHPIPIGWEGHGPRASCYTAHCGDTYVWVMPGQLEQLSEFRLVLLDIATTAPAWYLQQKQQATASVALGLPVGGRHWRELWTASVLIDARP